ncbi:MAG: YqiJ family protein [Kordiimonadaceae bacterium]|nr:YqiJ family protein [Kordiimonadaceae bacterium]MBO6568879.1 YqiJ family protein [Kordiimonadaceae bacterium]MBO6965146.1 YqiJ family protein [Kordiimonadaceae bacterium]
MIDFMLEAANYPFSIALAIMVLIAAIEGVGTLLGFALSGLLDNLMPELDIDVDTPDLNDHGAFGEFLTWLRLREVPVIVVLIAFLTSFSVTGYVIQYVLNSSVGFILPSLIAGPIALFLCLPGVRLFAGVLGKIMPKDETEAVGTASFIGRTAVITLGTASRGEPAQGRLKDKFGKSHYVMIEPDLDDHQFKQGEETLLVRQDGATFFAIKQP